MKNILIIFLLGFSTTLLSQENKFDFGLKIGGSYSRNVANSEDNSDTKFKGGFGSNFGITALYTISEKTLISGEIIYSKIDDRFSISPSNCGGCGYITLDGGSVSFISGQYKESTIHIPVLLRSREVKPLGFEIGPSLNYLLKRQIIYKQPVEPTFLDESARNDFNLGINAGVIGKISKSVFLHIRYEYVLGSKLSIGRLQLEYLL